MGLDYDTPLLTTAAQVSNLTGRQNIDALASGDLTVATLLLSASQWVYRRVQELGKDPTLITNGDQLKAAVAYYVVAQLVAGRHLDAEGADAQFYMDQAVAEVNGFRPVYADTAAQGRTLSEDLPMVGNFEEGTNFQLASRREFTYPRQVPRREA